MATARLRSASSLRGGILLLRRCSAGPAAAPATHVSAMELALALEKLVNEKLHNLHTVATRCNDPQLTDFVESEFLQEQVDAIKKILSTFRS